MTSSFSRPIALFAHFARMEMGSYLKTPAAIFWTFAYPVLAFFVLLAIFGLGKSGRPGLSYADYLISGLAVMTAISTAMFGVAAALIEHKANARLLPFEFMPFSRSIFIAGLAASRVALLSLFFALFVGALSHLLPTANPVSPLNLLLLILLLDAAALTLVGVGLLIAAAIDRPAVGYAISHMINVPVILISDLFLPVALFPKWLAGIVQYSPFVALVHTARSVYAADYALGPVALTIVLLLAAGIALLALAGRIMSLRPAGVAG
jgi:ABC-2 type transport system permease protein